MRSIWLLLSFPILVVTIQVQIELYLKCETMYTTESHVFLMEEDAGDDSFFQIFDPDDVLAHGQVEFNREILIIGDDDELGNLEPYLFLLNSCQKNFNDLRVQLPPARFRTNYYQLTVNLDKNTFDYIGPSDKPMPKLG